MKVLLSWIREFVDVDDSAEAVGRRMSMRGLALEGLEPAGTDALLDFDVTANRSDCLSIAGIAREIAVAYGVPFRAPAARLAPLASAAARACANCVTASVKALSRDASIVSGSAIDVRVPATTVAAAAGAASRASRPCTSNGDTFRADVGACSART